MAGLRSGGQLSRRSCLLHLAIQVIAADASSPSFPHLARGCPRARRRPWRGIRRMRKGAHGAEVWTLGEPGA